MTYVIREKDVYDNIPYLGKTAFQRFEQAARFETIADAEAFLSQIGNPKINPSIPPRVKIMTLEEAEIEEMAMTIRGEERQGMRMVK